MEIWPESLKGNQNIKPIHGSYIVGITVRQSKGLTQRCWIPCTLWVTSKLRKKQRCGSCHKEIISGTFKIIQEQRNLLPYNLDTHQKKEKKKNWTEKEQSYGCGIMTVVTTGFWLSQNTNTGQGKQEVLHAQRPHRACLGKHPSGIV